MTTEYMLIYMLMMALLPALVISLVGYVYSCVHNRFDIADVMWPVGIFSVTLLMFLVVNPPSFVLKLVVLLVTIWAVRLAWHIGSRFFAKQSEDPRYAQWRKTWQYPKIRGLFQVFLLQAIIMIVVASPIIVYVFNPGYVPAWQVGLGLWMWLTGFVFQAVGDWQLDQFIRNPDRYGLERGQLMTRGLWARTRHPNYFGEMMMWWGVFVMLLHTLNPLYLIPSLFGPLVISYLLYFVSGVKKTERHWSTQYGEQFTQYKKQTPALFPKLF